MSAAFGTIDKSVLLSTSQQQPPQSQWQSTMQSGTWVSPHVQAVWKAVQSTGVTHQTPLRPRRPPAPQGVGVERGVVPGTGTSCCRVLRCVWCCANRIADDGIQRTAVGWSLTAGAGLKRC